MEETNETIVEKARDSYDESKSALDAWNREAVTDLAFYLSDQWTDKDAAALKRKGVPVLNLNYIKKTVDMITGYQRQNRSDIKYYPIEGGDSLVAEVLSKISMWVMKSNNSRYYLSEASKDSLNMGIGWIYPEMDYSKDPVNGDIFIRQESPFNMLYDPYFTELDLSDCSYIIRQKLLHKNKAIELWPDHEAEIKKRAGAKPDQTFRQDADVSSDKGNMVLVWEYWYRAYTNKKFAISEDGEIQQIEDEDIDDYELAENVTIIDRKIPEIKVAIMVGKGTDEMKPLVVYHGVSPLATNEYPFIPIFCYLTTSYPNWDKKLQGVIRPMRDPQREKNKRRSQIMHMLNTVATSGIDVEKGAYDDVNAFKAGAGVIRERNRGFNPATRIPAPEMPSSIIQLEQMFTNDINVIGANPDLLGGVGEKGAAGITIQLRQKQGMTALQEVFDNLSMAIQRFGRMLVELIVANFDNAKIERILGEDMPYKMDIEKLTAQIQQMNQQLQQMATTQQQLAGRQTSDMQEYEQMDMQEKQLQQQTMQLAAQYEQAQQQLQQLQAQQKEFWVKWDDLEVNSRYDCSVSEAIENETYRISVLSALLQSQQYGMPVPPELILEYLDIPKDDKERMMQFVQAQQQAQAQEAQAKISVEQQKADNQMKIEMIKQGINPQAVEKTPIQ